jgi:hypothetical protein
MKEIKNETDAFRRKILNSIDISGCSFAKPTSVALSYINGKYALSLIPYGRYMIHDDGEVSVKPSIGSDLTIANTLLIKNYYIIKSALMELENNPPRYNVGYAQPRGYMSSTIEKHGITITVYDVLTIFTNNVMLNFFIKF